MTAAPRRPRAGAAAPDPAAPDPAPGGSGLRPRPVPDAEVLALLAVAVDQVWPRPVVVEEAPPPDRHLAWRFSSRWWSRPVPARRHRPWR